MRFLAIECNYLSPSLRAGRAGDCFHCNYISRGHTQSAHCAIITSRGYHTAVDETLSARGRTRYWRARDRLIETARELIADETVSSRCEEKRKRRFHTWRVLDAALRTWLLASSYPREPPRKSSLSPSLSRSRQGRRIYGEPRVGVARRDFSHYLSKRK